MSAAAGVPTGNTFDKYGSTNPLVRRLMTGFERAVEELFTRAAPESVLDVGCGEGILTAQWAARPGVRRIVGVDLEDRKLAAEWAARPARENLEFRAMAVESLGFEDGTFDLVAATEVLEHVKQPERAVAEMVRVAGRWLLVSVPHEPLWRMLNMARGAYVRDLGNTPGHLNHWSRAGLQRLLSAHGEVIETRSPFPWTMLLVAVG
jgi:2-polyprenyl-3-methyl-5-hydroxy-6-metoxy-1,4-benzoquinol methylase